MQFNFGDVVEHISSKTIGIVIAKYIYTDTAIIIGFKDKPASIGVSLIDNLNSNRFIRYKYIKNFNYFWAPDVTNVRKLN